MSNQNIPTGRFVWFEYISKDLAKAQAFYAELFHWKTAAMPMPAGGNYTMISADGVSIGGYLETPAGAPPHSHWLSHLQVGDAEATAKKVTANGGRIAMGPTKMGEIGTYAVALDPQGAAFALWQPGKAEGTGDFKGKAHTWVWNELVTPEPAKAAAFYKTIGNFDASDAMEMPTGAYHVLKTGDKSRAGIMAPMMAGVPAMWVPYIQVDKTDATVARAQKLGGEVKVPAMDVPNVGRFAILTDPNGAAFGVLQPA